MERIIASTAEASTVHASTAHRLIIPVDGNVELRSVELDDAEPLHQAINRNRGRLREWLPWLDGSRTLEHTREFVTQCRIENQERTALTTGIWVGEELAGAIGLHRINSCHRNTSIGYWLAEDFAGRGIMTKACRAMVTEAFRNYGLHRIEIRCAVGNLRSAAIPARLGFREEGLLADAEWLYDHWVDLRVFAMLEQHWPG